MVDIKKIIKYIFQVLIVGGIFLFFALKLSESWSELRTYEWTFTYGYLALALLFTLLIYACTVWGYHLILKKMAFNVPLRKTTKVRIISDMASYIPGKIWNVIGRFYLFGNQHLRKAEIFMSTAIEWSLLIISGSFVVIICMLFWKGHIILSSTYSYLLIALIPIFLIIIHPKVFSFFLNLMLKIIKEKYVNVKVTYKNMFELIIYYFSYWIISGLMLFFLVRSITYIPNSTIPIIIGIYAAAWVISFVSFIAPAGLGIREGIMTYLLAFYMPLPIAIIVSILVRILIAGFGFILAAISWRL